MHIPQFHPPRSKKNHPLKISLTLCNEEERGEEQNHFPHLYAFGEHFFTLKIFFHYKIRNVVCLKIEIFSLMTVLSQTFYSTESLY